MKGEIRITYYVDTDDMTESEYENQDDTVYQIPISRLIDLISDDMPNGAYIVEVTDVELV